MDQPAGLLRYPSLQYEDAAGRHANPAADPAGLPVRLPLAGTQRHSQRLPRRGDFWHPVIAAYPIRAHFAVRVLSCLPGFPLKQTALVETYPDLYFWGRCQRNTLADTQLPAHR